MSKLQNIKALNQLLAGDHKMQTRKSFIMGPTSENRANAQKQWNVGDTWEEKDATGKVVAIWEQREGYRTKMSPQMKVLQEAKESWNEYPNCLHPECITKPKNRLDKKFSLKRGMCADCVFEMETKLRISGQYEEYERTKMLDKAESMFRSTDSEIEDVKKNMTGKISFAKANGDSEDWSANEKLFNKLIEEYNQVKEEVLNDLNGKKE